MAFPLKPLDELYALPARRYHRTTGGAVETGAAARIDVSADAPNVMVGGRPLSARAVICAVPWYALAEVFPDRPAALSAVLDAAAQTAASPIVTVNLWFDRVVTDQMFIGLPGRTMQWVFDKRTVFGEQASHCRSCRAALRASSDAVTRNSSIWPSRKYATRCLLRGPL